MPTRHHLALVAKALTQDLGKQAFRSLPRMEITEKLRQISGEETTRIKADLAKNLEMELLLQGVRCFPPLDQTSTADTVRIFHTRTVVASLVDMLANPGPETDQELAKVTTKVKGMWNWSQPLRENEEGGVS